MQENIITPIENTDELVMSRKGRLEFYNRSITFGEYIGAFVSINHKSNNYDEKYFAIGFKIAKIIITDEHKVLFALRDSKGNLLPYQFPEEDVEWIDTDFAYELERDRELKF